MNGRVNMTTGAEPVSAGPFARLPEPQGLILVRGLDTLPAPARPVVEAEIARLTTLLAETDSHTGQ